MASLLGAGLSARSDATVRPFAGSAPMRVMALDPGERRIGVALSDELGLLATPLTIVERRSWEADLAAISALIRQHDVELLVVGHPITLRGEAGPQARRAERLAERVRSLGLPVELWDERFSTVEARERLDRRRGRRGRRGPAWPDAAAAAVILQDFLDSRRSRG